MLVPLATALVLSMTYQSPSPSTDRDLALQLARAGRTVEALALFERIGAENPADAEVRMWIALLQLRMGRTEEAEAGFRAVLREHPSDVDARIGLGAALTRRDAWSEALTVLLDAERDAGQNADLFAAIARAYRRGGDDRRALAYYRRAMALAPQNPELVEAYEAAMRVYGSSVAVEGYDEGGVSDARSVSLTATVRVLRRLEIEGAARVQNRDGSSDTLAGGGGIWRINRSTNVAIRGAGGADNISLPNATLMAEATHYRGAIEIGGNVRHLSFSDIDVTAATPILAWDRGGRWRLATRYTYSRSSFHSTGESSVDHSVLLRGTFHGWRRVDTDPHVRVRHRELRRSHRRSDRESGREHRRRHACRSACRRSRRWPPRGSTSGGPNDLRLDRVTVVVVQGF